MIAGQALKVTDIKDGAEVETVSKHKLKLHVDKVKGTEVQGATETAKVVAGDLSAGQSVVHVVDAVLLPPAKPSAVEESK